MSSSACPICHSEAISENISQVENIWPTPREVNFCTNCHAYYLATMPTESELVSYYKNDYYQLPYFLDQIKGIFRRSRSVSQAHYIQNAIHLRGGSVLEVGACDGMLLKQFAVENRVVGIELSDKYRELAKSKYNIDLLDVSFVDYKGKFNLVIMSHVLEHFPDIGGTVKKVKDLLKPGGLFFVEVPNSPLPVERTASELKYYLHGAHTFNFTVKSLRTLLLNYGFEIISLDRVTYNIPMFYSLARRQRMGEILIGSQGFSPRYAVDVLLFLGKILASPRLGFRKIHGIGEMYEGPGDTLRVIVRLN
jgi:2-polyprenyl-3-methyl-5-hydroxy-6-metoxy-1,4-benzoquinol methylase